MKNVIAIDGPAGAGKSTIARKLAKKINFKYLDTGAMYRAVTYYILSNNISIDNKKDITRAAQNMDISFSSPDKEGIPHILVNNKDITKEIRKPEINENVSKIAKIKGVRKALVKKQRKIAKNKKIIMDGRDIGTRVLPEAEYKFYITASLEERSKRRFQEIENKNITLKKVRRNLKRRDQIDKNRKHSPLKKAKDAICIDTTKMSICEVLKKILSIIEKGE
mgnify:CR=1 FL=1